ncbi:MAG: hypothetical protein EOP51_22445 [Sphingobacteriales bacterium]|nr:MAG: hypothetical protein EOP51_22445 [Sphingobacteriales bacterium]
MFAFTSSNKETVNPAAPALVQQWYDFTGDNPADPEDYTLRSPQTEPSCDGEGDMCAVKATAHGSFANKPNLADPSKIIRLED